MDEKIERIIDKKIDKEQKIIKTARISFDGDQYLVRIPKKISELFEIKKTDKIKFILSIPYIRETDKKIMVVEIID